MLAGDLEKAVEQFYLADKLPLKKVQLKVTDSVRKRREKNMFIYFSHFIMLHSFGIVSKRDKLPKDEKGNIKQKNPTLIYQHPNITNMNGKTVLSALFLNVALSAVQTDFTTLRNQTLRRQISTLACRTHSPTALSGFQESEMSTSGKRHQAV